MEVFPRSSSAQWAPPNGSIAREFDCALAGERFHYSAEAPLRLPPRRIRITKKQDLPLKSFAIHLKVGSEGAPAWQLIRLYGLFKNVDHSQQGGKARKYGCCRFRYFLVTAALLPQIIDPRSIKEKKAENERYE